MAVKTMRYEEMREIALEVFEVDDESELSTSGAYVDGVWSSDCYTFARIIIVLSKRYGINDVNQGVPRSPV